MYNKFRAVSSIQVILELCFPVLAIWVAIVLKCTITLEVIWQPASCTGLIVLLFFSRVSFAGPNDTYFTELRSGFVDALKAIERVCIADLLRSGFILHCKCFVVIC
jgi:hypothetical protein